MFHQDPCIFSGYPLNPCDELRSNEKYLKSLFERNDSKLITYYDGVPLMDVSNGLNPLFLKKDDVNSDEWIFLGNDGDQAYFAVQTRNPYQETETKKYIDLRSIAREIAVNEFSGMPSLLARGKMILDWHNRHQFCANCGQKSEIKKGGYVRFCSSCETEHFPRVDPVVIMLITYQDKCLLGRSPHFLPGMYSALAGFMEPGENIEEAVRREVLEEAGINIGKVDYIKSQPWPFPSSLMIGTFAEALNDNINIENDELEDAKWFNRTDIETVLQTGGNDEFRVPEKLAIARHLLEHWINKSD